MHILPSRYTVVPGLQKALATEHMTARAMRGPCNSPFYFDSLYRRLHGKPQDAIPDLARSAFDRAKDSDRYPLELKMEETALHLHDFHAAIHKLEKIREAHGDQLAFEMCQLVFAYRHDRKLAAEILEYFKAAGKKSKAEVLLRLSSLLRDEKAASAVLHANRHLKNPLEAVGVVVPMAAHLLHISGPEAALEFAKRILEHAEIGDGKKPADIVRAIEKIGEELSIASGH